MLWHLAVLPFSHEKRSALSPEAKNAAIPAKRRSNANWPRDCHEGWRSSIMRCGQNLDVNQKAAG